MRRTKINQHQRLARQEKYAREMGLLPNIHAPEMLKTGVIEHAKLKLLRKMKDGECSSVKR